MLHTALTRMAMAIALLLPTFSLAQEKAKAVEPKEQIKFEQDKAQAHMKELEERMFELAQLIRDSQPDDSARLIMGVQKAREHLIAEQMGFRHRMKPRTQFLEGNLFSKENNPPTPL